MLAALAQRLFQLCNSLTTETMAINDALMCRYEKGLHVKELVTDSKLAIQSIHDPTSPLGFNCFLIEDIKELLKYFNGLQVSFIPRN